MADLELTDEYLHSEYDFPFFPGPEPFTNCEKTYPSQNPDYSDSDFDSCYDFDSDQEDSSDFESRFIFHEIEDLPPPEPFLNSNKTYPSRRLKNSVIKRLQRLTGMWRRGKRILRFMMNQVVNMYSRKNEERFMNRKNMEDICDLICCVPIYF